MTAHAQSDLHAATPDVEMPPQQRLRCGRLDLEWVLVGPRMSNVRALHTVPHWGFTTHGAFAAVSPTGTEEVVSGMLRWRAHAEDLRLQFAPHGFAGIVGNLNGVDVLGDVQPDDAGLEPPRTELTALDADPSHPAIVQLERWTLREYARAAGGGRPPAWIDALVCEWEGEALESRAVRQWAAATGRHRSTLHRAFRKHLGLEPSAWILRERLRRAWLELETDRPLAEIAARCGFADQSHMNRGFRALAGRTPGELRRLRAASARPASKTGAGGLRIVAA